MEQLKGRKHLGDLGVDGRIYYNAPERNRLGSCGLNLSGSECGPVAVSCGHGPFDSIKDWEFFV
jgi:hypothetical protein